jgi:hypothetical protein
VSVRRAILALAVALALVSTTGRADDPPAGTPPAGTPPGGADPQGGGAPGAGQGADAGGEQGRAAKRAVERYLEALLAQDHRTFQAGDLELEVSVVPDFLMVLLAREYVRTYVEGRPLEAVRADLQRVADRSRGAAHRIGLILTLRHRHASGRDVYAFQGGLDAHLRVVAGTTLPLASVSATGPAVQVELTLFKANRSPAFSAEGNCPPVMRRTVTKIGDQPITLELVAKRDPSPRAKELRLQLAGFLHLTGRGIQGDQVDFEHGASAVLDAAPEQRFDLPLTVPAVPEPLADVMPSVPD